MGSDPSAMRVSVIPSNKTSRPEAGIAEGTKKSKMNEEKKKRR